MTHKTKLTVFALAASALLFTACKEHMNDEKYQSMPPTISGVTFHVAGTGSTDLRVGDKIVATVVQSSLGKLLYRADYSWETPSVESPTHTYSSMAIYDNDPHNPTDTIVASKSGQYTLKFKGTYHISGNSTGWGGNYTDYFSDNTGKVSYALQGSGYASYVITIEKKLIVQPALQQ